MIRFSQIAVWIWFALLGSMHVSVGQEIQRKYIEIEAEFQDTLSRSGSTQQQRLAANQRRVERLRSLVLDNSSPDSLTIVDRQYLARISKSLGEIDLAINIAMGILKEDPKDPAAHSILMSVVVERGSEDEAIGAIEQSLRETDSLRLVAPYYGSLAIRMCTQSAPRSAVRYFNRFFHSSIQVAQEDCAALLPIQSTLPLYQSQHLALRDPNQFSIDLLGHIHEIESLLQRRHTIEIKASKELESILVLLWAASILDGYTNHPKLTDRFNQAMELITVYSEHVAESGIAVDIVRRILLDGLIGGSHTWDRREMRTAFNGWQRSINASSEMPAQTRAMILASLKQVESHWEQLEHISSEGRKFLLDEDESLPVLEIRIGETTPLKEPEVLDQFRLLARCGVRKMTAIFPKSRADEVVSIKKIVEQEFANTKMHMRTEDHEVGESIWTLHRPKSDPVSCVGSSPQKAGYLAWRIIEAR